MLRDLDSKSCPKASPPRLRARRDSGAWFSYKVRTKAKLVISKDITSYVHAAGLGLEPRYQPSKGCVLPLDDPAILNIISLILQSFNCFVVIYLLINSCCVYSNCYFYPILLLIIIRKRLLPRYILFFLIPR